MSAAEDVVHRKVMLAEDLEMSITESLMDSWLEYEESDQFMGNRTLQGIYGSGKGLLTDMKAVLRASENFYVARPMMELGMLLADEMPDEELLPHDLPAMQGWMWFGFPYRQIDIRRQVLMDHAIMWSAFGGNVRIFNFTDRTDLSDSVNQVLTGKYTAEEMRRLPMLQLNHVFDMKFGERLPRGIVWDTPLPPGAFVDARRTDNGDGTNTITWFTDQHIPEMFDKEVLQKGTVEEKRSPLAAFLVTIWRLCQQSIASRLVEEPQRAARRRMTRAHLPVSPITIINLRRVSGGEHEETGVDWQHRWVVRGHWRRQPYKENGEVIHRYIYINPYLKGPEDKPLLHRDKVNALIR